MSGINPIIDTLLHEVLGKRIDGRKQGSLNGPINPVATSAQMRQMQSDSRLDARPALPWQVTSNISTSAIRPLANVQPNVSYASLSNSAAIISHVLSRMDTPSILKFTGILMSDQVGGPNSIAYRLRRSILDSGLFYESQLLKWHKGLIQKSEFAQNPQVTGRASPHAAQVVLPEDADLLDNALLRSIGLSGRLDEMSKSALMYQIEFLLSPVLRWQGWIWDNLYMSFGLTFYDRQSDPKRDEEKPDEDASGKEIALLVILTLVDLGDIMAEIRLFGSSVSINMVTNAPRLLDRMISSQHNLVHTLDKMGFLNPRVSVVLGEVPAHVS
jgi:hypothetical protein